MATRSLDFRYLIVLITIALLASCLGVQMETKFNADGSGTMVMKMTVSRAVLEMGEGDDAALDIPLSKDEIEDQFSDIDGITVVAVTEEETEENIIITSIVDFEDFATLLETDDSPLETATLTKKGGSTTYAMTVGEAKQAALSGDAGDAVGGEEVDEAMLGMIAAFLEGYNMEYRVTAPKQISRYTHGELSADGRTVSLILPMAEYFMLEKPYQFEVEW